MTDYGSNSLLMLLASSNQTFAVRFQLPSFGRSMLSLCSGRSRRRAVLRSEVSFDLIQPERDRSAGQMDS